MDLQGEIQNMNKNKRMIHLLNAGLLMAGLSLTHAMPAMAAMQFERPAGRVSMKPDQTDGNGIEFKLSETNGIYTVYMRPNATPASPNATISAQVTVKVPHGVAAPSEITSLISGTSWDLTSHDDAPAEAPDSDYLSFSLDFPGGDYRAFNWNSNTEQAVFSFKAGAGGHLMETCDAFAPPNSRSASVGNEITVLGYGDGSKSAYVGNYDQAHDCPTSEQAVSVVSLVAHSSVAVTRHNRNTECPQIRRRSSA